MDKTPTITIIDDHFKKPIEPIKHTYTSFPKPKSPSTVGNMTNKVRDRLFGKDR